MWSDNAARVDLLGYEDLLAEIVELAIDPSMQPLTIGAFADWGAGKSTLLNLAAVELCGRDVLVVEFSPWLVEGYDDVKSCLLGAVLDEIAAVQDPATTTDRVKELLKSLHRRVNWLRLAKVGASAVVPFAGVAIETLEQVLTSDGDDVATMTASSTVSRGFHREFEELVEAAADLNSIVVLIDDLDRCLPDQVIETLEAIRLFLSTKGTAFVIAADERLVRDAVRRRYAAASEVEVDLPQEYLEKLVQVPLRIPPLTRPDTESYCNLLVAEHILDGDAFEKVLTVASEIRASGELQVSCNIGIVRDAVAPQVLPAELEVEFALVEQVIGPLASGLKGNPRQIKRYLNTLDLRRRTAVRRGIAVDQAILAKLVVLEYVRNDRYRTLHTWQERGGGLAAEIARLEEAVEGEVGAATADPDIGVWAADPWTIAWLKIDPRLTGVDLSTYFFLSRDRVADIGGSSRLPPGLQVLLSNLESDIASIRESAVDEARALGIEEQLLLLDASSMRLGALTDKHPLMISLIEIASEQPALTSVAMAALGAVAYSEVPPDIPLVVAGRFAGDTNPEVLALLDTWEKQAASGSLSKSALQARKSVEGKRGHV